MFSGCSSLMELPNISNWNLSDVKDNYYVFFGCNEKITNPNKLIINAGVKAKN